MYLSYMQAWYAVTYLSYVGAFNHVNRFAYMDQPIFSAFIHAFIHALQSTAVAVSRGCMKFMVLSLS